MLGLVAGLGLDWAGLVAVIITTTWTLYGRREMNNNLDRGR